MTSLNETLPILDEAVPALPDKIESVAKAGAEYQQSAQQALGAFRQRRAEAEALAGQIRQALEALHDAASAQQQQLASLGGALEQAVQQEAGDIREGADDLHAAGERTGTAFDQLEADLVQVGDRTEGAQQDARGAIEALAAEVGKGEQELDAATEATATAVGALRQAIEDGQDLVDQGVAALRDAMVRLLADAQERLGRTDTLLDTIQAEQEKAVSEATSALDASLRQVQLEIEQRVEREVSQELDPELDSVAAALDDLGQGVLKLQAATESRREELAEPLSAAADHVPPLQGGAEQVRQAADQVGISWP